MAKIPEYQQQFDKQNVELGAPKQQLNIPAAAFGSDGKALQEAGKGLQDAGSVLAAVRTRMGEEKNQADANRGLTELLDVTMPYETQVAASKGEAALGVTDGMREHIRGEADKIRAKLSPGAQELFDARVETHYREKVSTTALHETKERQEYRFTSADALAVREGQNALTNFNNAQVFDAGVARAVEKKLEALAVKGFGADSEQAKSAIAAFSSILVRERAQTYLNRGAYGEAKAIATNDARLLPQDREALEKEIKPLATLGRAQEFMDSTRGMGLNARLDLIRKSAAEGKLDPDTRAKSEELAKGEYHLQISQQREADYQNGKRVTDSLVRAWQAGDIKKMDAIAATAGGGQSLHAVQLAAQLKSGSLTTTDPETEWRLTQLAANDPQAFRAEWNPLKYSTTLNARDMNKFDSLYLSIGKGEKNTIDEFTTDAELKKQTADQLGIGTGASASEDDKARLYKLNGEYERLMEEEQRAKGRKLTSAEKRQVIDKQILLPGTVEGLWGGRKSATKFGAKLGGKTTFEANIPPRPAGAPKNAYWDHALGSYVFERNDGVVLKYTGSNK